MKYTILKNNYGIALIITLGLVVLLVAGAVELNYRTRSAIMSSAEARDHVTLQYMASSGIHVAMAMLARDKKNDEQESKFVDSLFEDWADPEKIGEALDSLQFERGAVDVAIRDELGKLQVNALVDFPEGKEFKSTQRELWDRFLRPVVSMDEDTDINETADIINSVKDWLDSGDDDAITGLNGAESDYYETLDPPYECRNGPFTHIKELFLVKGFTPELVQGLAEAALDGFGGSGLEDTGESLPPPAIETDISDYMTVYGMSTAEKKIDGKGFTYPGKININTADIPVIAVMLPDGYEYLAPAIDEYRRVEPGTEREALPDLSSATWYKDVPGCSDVKIDPGIITTFSDVFCIESYAKLDDAEMKITAIVQREKDEKTKKWMCRILSWQPE